MKSLKNLWMGLATLAVAFAAFSLFSSHRVLADTVYVDPTKGQICVPKYTPTGDADHHAVAGWLSVSFRDRAHLVATYHPQGACASPSGYNDQGFFGQTSYSDIFKNISGQANTLYLFDSTADSNVSYNSPVGGSGADDPIINGFGSNLDDLMKDGLGGHDQMVSSGDLQSVLNTTQIHLGLESNKTGYTCSDSNADTGSDNFVLVDGNPPHWRCVASTGISGLKGLVLGPAAFSDLNNDNFNVTYTVQTDGTGHTTLQPVFENETGSRTLTWCPNVTTSGAFVSKSCTGNLIVQASLAQINALGNGYGNFNMSNFDGSGAFQVRVAGADTVQANAIAAGNGNISPDTNNGADSCGGSWELAYLACPVLNVVQDLANHLEGLFESQLSFTLDRSVDSTGQARIYKSWSIFRDLASSVLVIVMLMMVISQALGTEAYAVKKMLPRLVIATILMQISFQLFSWVVNIFDDVGHGLAFLLYYPFGGEQRMSLGALLANASVGGWSAAGINYTVLFGGALALSSGPIIGLALAGAFSAFVSIVVGLAVLEFRKLLILLLLILVPLALIAWTFPGQSMQGYWKKWYDNFLKTLMMYPMLVLLIAAGRIMANVAGNTGNGTVLNTFIIFVGFFGPLFILPKTYKWGGSLISAAGSWADKQQSSLTSKGTPGLKNWVAEKYTDRLASDYNPFKKTLGSQRLGAFMQSTRAGRYIPTKAGYAKMVHRGQQWSGKMAERNDAVRDKFVRTVEANGMTAKQVQDYDKYVKKHFGKSLGKDFTIFTPDQLKNGLRKGIGSGKKAGQLMAYLAAAKGDKELNKSIGRYHIRSKSLLELADKDFVFPEVDKAGKVKAVPFWDWQPAIDQIFKDPSLWQEMGSMRSDLTPNNVPHGGARYGQILARAGLEEGEDINGRPFEIGRDIIRQAQETLTPDEIAEYQREFVGPDGKMKQRPYLLQKLQAISQDTLANAKRGGNSLLSFANEITRWTEGDGYYGEGASRLPAEEFTKFVVDQMKTATGRATLSEFKSTPEHKEAIDKALHASGYRVFVDAVGREHELNVDELFKASEDAEKEIAALKNAAAQRGETYTPPHVPDPVRRGRSAAGGGGPQEEYPGYYDTGGRWVPPIPPQAAAQPAPLPRESSTPLLHGTGPAPQAQPSSGGVVFDRNLEQRLDELTGAIRQQTTEGRKTRETIRNIGSVPGRPIRSGPEWPSEGPPPGGNEPGERPGS